MNDDDGPLRALRQGFGARGLKTARLLARTGLRMAARSAGLAERAGRGDGDEAAAVAAAQALLAELEGLKGLAMKLGQMVSYLDRSLPPAAREVLARLQSQSKPMAEEVIARVIAADLGRPPHQLYEAFEGVPFAAASIGQVHRAAVAGRPVAVKVRYPEIDRAIATDIATLRNLSRVLGVVSPIDVGALVREIATRVSEECDYLREADNQERMRGLLSGLDGVSIPEVYRSHSGRSVLTTAWSGGAPYARFAAAAGQAARDRAGLGIYRAAFTGIFVHGVYNADPHPGNYLFSDDGHVTLLDFGCVKWFDPAFIAGWKRLARSILDGDRAGFRSAFVAAGLVRKGKEKGFDFDHQYQAMRFLYSPMLATEPFAFTEEFVVRVNDVLMFKNANKLKFDMPPDWLFVNRLQFGMFSVLAGLGSRARWGETFRACLNGGTSPAPEKA
jgi:predicted unusual protein kinase regulating ubiquinone biosynthesis (AarF/ABC1/UbiB family)